MPARLFWMMERNIPRVRAEQDIRAAILTNRAASKEGAESLIESLGREIGETVVIKRSAIVKGEKDAKTKMMRLLGKG